MYQTKTRELVNNLPGLVLAIQKVLNKQEKDFGCFQVKKEADFCSLYIPSFPSFKLYQNSRTHVYKGYWQTSDILPDIKDRTNKPQIYVKKRQISVEIKQQEVTESQNLKLVAKKQKILENQSIKSVIPTQQLEVIESKTIKLIKKQRIYEVMYKYHSSPEVNVVNQLIASCLKEKIAASITSVPETEIMPLVLVTEDTKD